MYGGGGSASGGRVGYESGPGGGVEAEADPNAELNENSAGVVGRDPDADDGPPIENRRGEGEMGMEEGLEGMSLWDEWSLAGRNGRADFTS